MTWMFNGAFGWLSSLLLGALTHLWSLLAGFALTDPDVTVLPQVRDVSARSLVVVNTVYVLAFLAAGIVVMTRETISVRYGIADLAPRLVVGLVAANLALPLCAGLIETANALTQALTGDSIASSGSVQQLSGDIATAMAASGTGPVGVLALLIGGMLLALTMTLLMSWLVRVGVLVVLTGIAPLALACHGLPYTESVARLWWRSMAGVLLVVTAQAFALHTTLAVFLSARSNLPALGLPLDPGGTINLFVVACLLWATVRIPSLAHRFVTTVRPSAAASMVRVVLVQQLARGFLPGRAVAAPARMLLRLARRR